MAQAAKVTSIDAVGRMSAALQAFRAEAGSGLDDLQMEIQRGLQWIHHDCREYWSVEVRRASERVTEARLNLQQAMTYRRVADHQPTCIDEKRALAAAKRRLQIAQDKVQAVRHWARVIDRAVDEYRGVRTPFIAIPRRRFSQGPGDSGPHERSAAILRRHGDAGRAGRFSSGVAAGRAARRSRRRRHGAATMRTCDLSAGVAKLELAAKALHQSSRDIEESWDDQIFHDFQETYVASVEPKLKNLLEAVRRLAGAFASAEHQCSDDDHG